MHPPSKYVTLKSPFGLAMFPFASDGIFFGNSFLTLRFCDLDIPTFQSFIKTFHAETPCLKENYGVQHGSNNGLLKTEFYEVNTLPLS